MTDELHPGDTLGSYRLDQRLGGGGFGSVWKAVDGPNGRVVALKVLKTDVYSGDTIRLRSEVELLAATASSRSPHVVKVLGGGAEPQPYVVMEFIDGVDLARELERRKRIPQMETIRIGQAVAEALAALESVGIIHRDVKPANVMIDVDGVVKLTDFGIAKIVGYDTITATSQMPMSMAYAAPEVWEGNASHRSDLYALGILLFQCLAGRPPFTGSYAQVYRQHTSKEPDWTLLPEGTVPALRDLLRDCLAKTELDRPENASVVHARLDEAERELRARIDLNQASDLPVHEPQAFGPWLRQSPHPTRPWTFLCIHETSGEKATVEIHFSDDIELGSQLRKAVEANSKLVPLGAERLLGTNRLVLRPGEAWTETPPGQFAFWVAREELPAPVGTPPATKERLELTSRNAHMLDDAAAELGIVLNWAQDQATALMNGTIHLKRPGLPGEPRITLIQFLDSRGFSGESAMASGSGVAIDADESHDREEEQETGLGPRMTGFDTQIGVSQAPRRLVHRTHEARRLGLGATSVASDSDVEIDMADREPSISIRVLAFAGMALLVGVATLGIVWKLFTNGGDGPVQASAPTPTVTASVGTPTATPSPPTDALTYVVRSGDTCSGIAAGARTSVQQLLDANEWSEDDCTKISVGQIIRLPAKVPTVAPTPTSSTLPSTPTPIPPTATPIPPTATPIPPTATPIPPTAIPPTPIPSTGAAPTPCSEDSVEIIGLSNQGQWNRWISVRYCFVSAEVHPTKTNPTIWWNGSFESDGTRRGGGESVISDDGRITVLQMFATNGPPSSRTPFHTSIVQLMTPLGLKNIPFDIDWY